MTGKNESSSRNLGRSIGMGMLLTMLFFYSIHLFGKWRIENYRPDPETTSSVLLQNECAILGNTHTLRPASGITTLSDGIDGTKLAGSFMNFFDGHISAMVILFIIFSGLIFILRSKLKNRQAKESA